MIKFHCKLISTFSTFWNVIKYAINVLDIIERNKKKRF